MAKHSRSKEFRQKYLSHPLQGLGAYFFYWLFACLPIDASSKVGSCLMRKIGPKLSVQKRARRNMTRAFPEKSEAEINDLLDKMWDNLGRMVGEIPHLHKIRPNGPRLEVVGIENGLVGKNCENGGLFFAGHIGNWELGMTLANVLDMEMMCVYRAPDNPWVDKLYLRARKTFRGEMVKKGSEGARKLTKYLKSGGHTAMLIDQKMSDGIAIPFFGRDAMTAPALAAFALKYDAPIIPLRVERLKGAHFRMTFYPAMEIAKTGDRQADVEKIMTDVNAMLEGWIRERPEQWLWPHKRWPD